MNYSAMDGKYADRIRSSFKNQGIMRTIQGKLEKIAPGEVHISFPFSAAITQQHGFVHAGILTTVVDSACGYAASTLMPSESEVLTIEYKVNFISPAIGEEFIAIGRVEKPGRTITVCTGEVKVKEGAEYKTVVLIQATMMAVSK
jgi:uncharacterized protein (TIGR00369 family)